MSPRTDEQFAEMREQSKAKILETSLELFAKYGYHATSVSKLAKTAGVSKGLIYNYFDSKEDILKSIIGKELEVGEVIISEMLKLETSKEKLKFVIEYAFDYMIQNFDHYKLLVTLSFQVIDFPYVEKMSKAKHKEYLPMIEFLLQDIGIKDAGNEALILSAILDGVGVQYLVLHKDYPGETVKKALLKKYDL